MKRIAIFASGGGSNADNIIRFLTGNEEAIVVLILTNKANAGVFKVAEQHGIPCLHFTKDALADKQFLPDILKGYNVDLIVLAGFLLLIPSFLIQAFPKRIINIHPALLPKYGGKGMYGHFVHEAVHANKEKESGITIHFANEHYDEGDIIFQGKTAIEEGDTAADIERKVRALEAQHFPRIVLQVVQSL
jgi:phosphoribosylglycinamide formyltransferase-1